MLNDEPTGPTVVTIPSILIAGLAAREQGALAMVGSARGYLNASMNGTFIVNLNLYLDDIMCSVNDEYMR